MKKTKILTLGPAGTYSHEAANKISELYRKDKHVYTDLSIAFMGSIQEVFESLEKAAADNPAIAVLPFENSIHGTVLETLDLLQQSDFKIIDEIVLDIHHCCAVSPDVNIDFMTDSITKIYSHPQAIFQCKEYISKNFPKLSMSTNDIEMLPSTSSGFKKISEDKIKNAMAIGSKFAAQEYGLKIVDENIEDVKNNQTLFVVIDANTNTDNKSDDKSEAPELSGAIKSKYTYLSVTPENDRPGLLHEIITIFKDNNVNMSKIESRPRRDGLGKYAFYFKLDMSANDESYSKILSSLKEKKLFFKILSR